MVFKEINKDSNLYCNSCFSRVAKVTVRFGTANNAIAVRLCGECYGKLSSLQQEELEAQIEKMKCCGNCTGNCNSEDMIRFCKDNNYKLWEVKEND